MLLQVPDMVTTMSPVEALGTSAMYSAEHTNLPDALSRGLDHQDGPCSRARIAGVAL
jgi:hypothetical protein